MIYLGADHRGYELKEKIKSWLSDLSYDYEDCGASMYNKDDDYPEFAKLVGEKVTANPNGRGIVICGSGIGIAVAANKLNGIRAGTAVSPDQARASVNDEDLNILALSADYINEDEAEEIIKAFLEAKFSGEDRHIRRLKEIDEIEKLEK
jgi:ribose 5-phosphate isomerase B